VPASVIPGKTRSGNRWLKQVLCKRLGRRLTRGTLISQLCFVALPPNAAKSAVLAVAHSLLVTAHVLLHKGQTYQELGSDYFDRMHADGLKRYCLRKSEAMGHKVILEPAA
jgi:hypothetical protein